MAIDTDRSERTWWQPDLKGAIIAAGIRFAELLERVHLYYRFTTLTGRIVFLNLFVLAVLISSIFYFSKTEAWLIETKLESLRTQGEIIAAAISAKARLRTDRIVLDPKIFEPATGSRMPRDPVDLSELEFSIRPERIAPILRRLVEPTGNRVRVYDARGEIVLDSNILFSDTSISRDDLPPPGKITPPSIGGFWTRIQAWFNRSDLPVYKDIGRANGKAYTEVRIALQGETTPLLLVNTLGQHVISVAIPIRGMTKVKGALLLSTRGGELDKLLNAERWSIIQVTLLALLAILLSSALLASTIGAPLHKLSQAAEDVSNSLRRRQELPDFTNRADEIGDLSGTLRNMTDALYRRIEASERFAADVAHELKNPLTSVRSAAETMSIVDTDETRRQLSDTIQNDVKRLTRLINDIANASRLDAEMTLRETRPVDIARLLQTLTEMFNDTHAKNGRNVVLELADTPLGSPDYIVIGHDSRLGQVVRNLLDNALSFSPPNGTVHIRARAIASGVRILIEDEGPGIPPDNIDRIFSRFYTDRPEADAFGSNSGLGLSISREIIHAHGGTIRAENRYAEAAEPGDGASSLKGRERTICGARFIIELPARGGAALRGVRRGGQRR